MVKSKDLAILILAAGTSSRLGEPKQLVLYQDKSLLENACKKALEISNDVYVVLGAKFEECKSEIEDLAVNIIQNQNYKEGLSSSLRVGIKELKEFKRVLIMLCDQPFISSSHLQNLIDKSNESNKIVCSYYKNDVAVPAVFSNQFYDKLLSLNGDKGAKKIIKENLYEKITLDDKMAIDIDTKEDKEALYE